MSSPNTLPPHPDWAERWARCLICRTPITWTDSPGGGSWDHGSDSDGDHEAMPIPVSDGPLGQAVARLDDALSTETNTERAAVLYEWLIGFASAAYELTSNAAFTPTRPNPTA
ncbi:hypothetical protein [Streptomyces sp. AcE210]|uniref:hypothetical protein n=1 Tax=Streptomyces sp. AcE210 TaxID=2292703 RepID=UPI000E3005B8|nr:hypothetical protein [Streptomyces sp. AcE210]RFC75506.1 hypothetical protein DXZ75_13420 [Streptomyces sp. AcE210]